MSPNSCNRLNPVPVHRVAVVRSFAQFLADVGAPVEREFRLARLPYTALEDVNNYVPSHNFWAFLVHAARSQGIPDLGFRVGEAFGANSVDPNLTDLLFGAPTASHGLWKACELVNKTISHCQVGLFTPPGGEQTYLFHRPSCDRRNPAINQIGGFGLTTLIGMIRVFAGPQWQPTEIGIMTRHEPTHYFCERFPNAQIRLDQQHSYIALDSATLKLPPSAHQATLPLSASPPVEYIHNDFVNSFEQVLQGHVREQGMNVEMIAASVGMSKRTLQRVLKERGTRYSEVLDRARLRLGRRMLQDAGMQISDISYRLGYSDPTHFSRAFRRSTGVNPSAYREQFLSKPS